MQKIVRVPFGVKEYLRNPDCFVTDDTARCVFCKDQHRLRKHGWYSRQALFETSDDSVQIPVRRLFCAHTGRTVSLLPDFCLPRRQHGPAVLGIFLEALICLGLGLLAAIRRARPQVPCRSVAQSLLQGFRVRLPKLRVYVSRLNHRIPEVPDHVPRRHRALAPVFLGMLKGFESTADAVVHHGRGFHDHYQIGLA